MHVTNRSISISLEEGLLAQLDAALNAAYVHLASLEGGDLAEASDAALAMALEVDAAPTDG